MFDALPPAADRPIRSGRSPVPWMVWFGIAGVVLSAVGVLAMPSPLTSQDSAESQAKKEPASTDVASVAQSVTDDDAAGRNKPISDPVEMAAFSPGDAYPTSDVDGTMTLPSEPQSTVGSGADSDDRRVGTLYRLVDEICRVTPGRIMVGPDALTIDLPLATSDDPCLDNVALDFDREHPGAPELLFDVLAAEEEQGFPVLHISAIHSGTMPYLHLKSGKTLFVGAIVDGWELSSINESGAAFTHGDRTFSLQTTDHRDPS